MSIIDQLTSCLSAIYPNTRVDQDELRRELQAVKSSAAHFYAEQGNNVLVAVTDGVPFSQKKHSTMQVWLGNGGGIRLLRDYVEWLRGRKAIRTASFTPLFDDDRLEPVMERFGFRRHGGVYLWER